MCTLWPRAEQGEQYRKVSTALAGVQAAALAECPDQMNRELQSCRTAEQHHHLDREMGTAFGGARRAGRCARSTYGRREVGAREDIAQEVEMCTSRTISILRGDRGCAGSIILSRLENVFSR